MGIHRTVAQVGGQEVGGAYSNSLTIKGTGTEMVPSEQVCKECSRFFPPKKVMNI